MLLLFDTRANMDCMYYTYYSKLTLSMPRGTDGSFQPVPSMTIVSFIVTFTSTPSRTIVFKLSLGVKNRF